MTLCGCGGGSLYRACKSMRDCTPHLTGKTTLICHLGSTSVVGVICRRYVRAPWQAGLGHGQTALF